VVGCIMFRSPKVQTPIPVHHSPKPLTPCSHGPSR
jgi:hypothetical protein